MVLRITNNARNFEAFITDEHNEDYIQLNANVMEDLSLNINISSSDPDKCKANKNDVVQGVKDFVSTVLDF